MGPLSTTRATCPPDSLAPRLASSWPYIRSYLIEAGHLHLSLMADGGIYVWARATGASSAAELATVPEQGGPRNWEVVRTLNLREQPSTSARILGTYRPGTILDNLGCQRIEGRAWCDVQQLGGGPRGYVAAEYLRPAISPDGSAAMGSDDSALRAGQGRFDATGPLPCAMGNAPMGSTPCEFGVIRGKPGNAEVHIKPAGGLERVLTFMGNKVTSGTDKVKATKGGDLWTIEVNDYEHYQVSEAVISGG